MRRSCSYFRTYAASSRATILSVARRLVSTTPSHLVPPSFRLVDLVCCVVPLVSQFSTLFADHLVSHPEDTHFTLPLLQTHSFPKGKHEYLPPIWKSSTHLSLLLAPRTSVIEESLGLDWQHSGGTRPISAPPVRIHWHSLHYQGRIFGIYKKKVWRRKRLKRISDYDWQSSGLVILLQAKIHHSRVFLRDSR